MKLIDVIFCVTFRPAQCIQAYTVCIAAMKCKTPPTPMNGYWERCDKALNVSSQCTFKCMPHFVLPEYAVPIITCILHRGNAEWDGPPTNCMLSSGYMVYLYNSGWFYNVVYNTPSAYFV